MEDAALSTGWADVREELLRLARSSATRRQTWSREMPCDWSPGTIENPRTGLPFTDESAWNLICDLLEAEHPFTRIELQRPPGALAYAATVRLHEGMAPIYIKIQLRHGIVWGRSFHIDLRSR